ncbi:TPA: 16S rRNA (cytosine(1402)-N(4))-methyltransferase [Candidatus Dependentiae bacterium]|nr:MAG: Ribosomal RNA small subunit methyltransferase H [candidate division TM6 bacterium GW2011_GWF2_36_131]KKQ02583.1 MAG: Ribosomal RNA small subunit methyltransferase H [candidate division TM6 bacterium GW2011_GWE2_36_25]KKQ19077.1 MAG: Ribosomal RNA small subunit methyltransferase H [candidate division TM6 bacterium GW2011_GWA2_36_9]HBR70168.1 16S rRNA (cytosine(1402)-N(4))-methyltransferase [Candidatus Dependentiae bacterium]HCU00100.1 16S rRNA (cytosine(1402)-N(4))-methyltransferase [Can
MNRYHKSVLVNEVLFYLNPQPKGIYIDATFGGGGHTRAILTKEPTCRVIAFDWDRVALEKHAAEIKEEFGERITLLWGNFAQMQRLLKKELNITQVDGILADFGTSQAQIFEKEGFSFAVDSFLDMRMSPAHQKMTAAYVINNASERELATIFFEFGEERYSRKIARAIVEERKKHAIERTKHLADLIESVLGKRGHIHPATKVFQALRIYVNKELDNIKMLLQQSLELLSEGGRLVCISFHSLEDRLVKRFLVEHPCLVGNKGFEILTKNIVVATEEEIGENPSSRSARLRAAQRC